MKDEMGQTDEKRIDRIGDAGKATQFGSNPANMRHNIPGANKPWSVRHSLRDLAHREIDQEDIENKSENELIRKLIPTKKTTLVQRGAALKLVRMAKSGDDVTFITEQIDGKLAQTNINTEFAELQNMTDEQLNEYINRAQDQRQSSNGDIPSGGTENPGTTREGEATVS